MWTSWRQIPGGTMALPALIKCCSCNNPCNSSKAGSRRKQHKMVLERSQPSIIVQVNPKPSLLLCKVPKSPVSAGWRSSRPFIPCPKSTAPVNPLLQTSPHSWVHCNAALPGMSAAEPAVCDECREDFGEWTKMSYHKWQVPCSQCHKHSFQQSTSSLSVSSQALKTYYSGYFAATASF